MQIICKQLSLLCEKLTCFTRNPTKFIPMFYYLIQEWKKLIRLHGIPLGYIKVMCLRFLSWKIYSIQLVVYYTFNIARTKGSYWKKICRITMTKNALEVNFFHVPHGYFLGRKSSLCVSRQEEFGTLVGICTSQGVSMILRVS